MSKSYLSISDFDLTSASSSGGLTGSKRVEGPGASFYQLKSSILDAKFVRRFKAKGTDRENFGEFIASTVSRAVTGADSEGATELVPKVSLVYNPEQKKILVASKYLKDVVDGTLDDYAKKTGKLETEARHVHVSATGPGQDTFDISSDDKKQLRQDLARAIALSCLSGDHDVNPGNMMAVRDAKDRHRIARIDFGHAFNDLLNAPKRFGGQVRNKESMVMDFLNRETVGHLQKKGRVTKLWRDYEGIGPSAELAQAFRELGESKGMKDGVAKARQGFQDLIGTLDPVRDKKTLDHIKRSLIAISNNVSDEKISSKASVQDALDQAFNNLSKFYERNQQQMLQVSKLMDLQVKIDKMLTEPDIQKKMEQNTEIQGLYDKIEKTPGPNGIEWIKSSKDSPAFKGSLDEFIKHRQQELEKQKDGRAVDVSKGPSTASVFEKMKHSLEQAARAFSSNARQAARGQHRSGGKESSHIR